jgi:hypothetical protein
MPELIRFNSGDNIYEHCHLVKAVGSMSNGRLYIVFDDDSERIYDVNRLAQRIPFFASLLAYQELFYNVYPQRQGNAVIWNEDYDIASDELYENGVAL